MRAEIVHVTDHALLRWRERAALHASEGAEEIVAAVKNSRVLKKKEPLPYPMPRLPNSVYSVNGEVLFILESVTIVEYRLVTVITADMNFKQVPKRKGYWQKQDVVLKDKSERQKIVEEKIKLEKDLSQIPRFDPAFRDIRNETKAKCKELDDKLLAMKELKKEPKKEESKPLYWKPPIILTDVEKVLVSETLMEVAELLGLVEDFGQALNLSV